MNKDYFKDLHGLSCVENYFLYLLYLRNEPYIWLYSESFVPFKRVYKDFIENSARYESYGSVTRLHDSAKGRGLIKLDYVKDNNLTEMKPQLDSLRPNEYMLIKISPEFIKNKFNSVKWRDDHFALLLKERDSITLINDSPAYAGLTEWDELDMAYDNTYIIINFIREPDKNDLSTCRQSFEKCITSYMAEEISVNEKDIQELIRLRDALGVYRVLIKRVIDYSNSYLKANIKHIEAENLDRIYSAVEYLRIRKRYKAGEIRDMVRSIEETERSIITEIKKHIN